MMEKNPLQAGIAAIVFAFTACAGAQDARKELRRADLTGTPDTMEVILSVAEYKPAASISLHFHHGIEAGYVLEGGKVQVAGKPPMELATGHSVISLRDVPHGGWTNVGSSTIKLLTVHVVDKGKPLYDEKK